MTPFFCVFMNRFSLYIFLVCFTFGCDAAKNESGNDQDSFGMGVPTGNLFFCDSIYGKASVFRNPDFRLSDTIPLNYEEAVEILDAVLSDSLHLYARCVPDGELIVRMHFGLGMAIRNEWGLWTGSQLADSIAKLGVVHPDDMSSLIINAFEYRAKGKKFPIREHLLETLEFYDGGEGGELDSVRNAIKVRFPEIED